MHVQDIMYKNTERHDLSIMHGTGFMYYKWTDGKVLNMMAALNYLKDPAENNNDLGSDFLI